ncbi:MAG: HEPN domain-containing protein [Proteobacteria bacterium]|nr:HEPN domain-containing protein [Pseudomonadota bacterium]
MEQAKADYNAAESLLHDSVVGVNAASSADPDADGPECKYPALVCFLCHDTVEKCIKAVLYAFCGLDQGLVNNSSLVMLKDALSASPHHPKDLLDPINECVNTINKHENMSRFPNYRHYPPCAPASTYYMSDAMEALSATRKLLRRLQSEAPLDQVLMDLGQLPAKRFMSALQSPSNDQGVFHIKGF